MLISPAMRWPALLLLPWIAYAAEPVPLPDLAREQGYEAVHAEVSAIVAAAPSAKKRDKELAARRFAALTMPVFPVFGAELTLTAVSDLGDCAWDGRATCRFTAGAPAGARADDFAVACRTMRGSTVSLDATATRDGDDRLVFAVSGVEACWEIGGSGIKVFPRPQDDLEGVGQGTDLIPPELSQLSWQEAERIIKDREAEFAYCTRKFAEDGERARGAMKVAYRIAADGTVASATVESATFSDGRVQTCILERFGRLRFPPPMGGFEGGTFPFTFL